MSEFKALILSGTLKPRGQFSHTETLAGVLIEEMKKYDIESEIVRLNEYKIPPGVESKEGKNDEWPKILRKILECHILIFATPIWWGIQSSLIQRAIERMDALNDELLETGKSELANKVGGLVITGAEDGAQHIIGNILNFMVWNGLTMPPACSLSFLGSAPKETEDSYRRKFKKKPTISMARTMAAKLCFFARLLKENPMPQDTEAIRSYIAAGTVGMKGAARSK